MNKIILFTAIYFFSAFLCREVKASSRYLFSFHHYNDIYSYNQVFSLPTQSTKLFFWNIDASQDASKNMTLAKEEDRYLLSFALGIRPFHFATITCSEKASQNRIETEQLSSKVKKNEFSVEALLQPFRTVSVTPYIIAISDRYVRTPEDSFSIDNPGTEKGIKGVLDIKNITNIETELAFIDQEISSEKRGLIDAGFDKVIKDFRIGGNFEGKNILTHYPILNGREEKFLESARGNFYSDFAVRDNLVTFIHYEGSFQNELYTLLEGFGGKHNNEKRTYHTIATDVNYQMNEKLGFDVSVEGYRGKRAYQDGINDEHSTVKTLTPRITFCPHRNARMTLKHSIRLSSFSFPNPVTVTDRDILEKSIWFSSSYALPHSTDLFLSLGRTENHTVYIRSQLSANNVKRTSYTIETMVSHFANNIVKLEERFSLVANYQVYDFKAQRNLFTRNFSHQSKFYLLVFQAFEPSVQYKLIQQDWGPYLYSYDVQEYVFYPNVGNKKESFIFALEVKPFTLLSITPTYTRINNYYENFIETSQTKTAFIEEYYAAHLKYKENEAKFIDFDITWVKRDEAKSFFEIKTRISFSV